MNQLSTKESGNLDEEVRAIADNTELPTFENTIIALERSGKLLDKVISASSTY